MYIDIPKIIMSYSDLLEDEPLRRASVRTLQGDLEKANLSLFLPTLCHSKKIFLTMFSLPTRGVRVQRKSPEESLI